MISSSLIVCLLISSDSSNSFYSKSSVDSFYIWHIYLFSYVFPLICSVYKAHLSPCNSQNFPRVFIKYWCHIYHFWVLGIWTNFKQWATVWSFQTIPELSHAEITHVLVTRLHRVCFAALLHFRGKSSADLAPHPPAGEQHLSYVSIAFRPSTFGFAILLIKSW